MAGGESPRRILFARSVDSDNLNAQSKNVKEILKRWRSNVWRPVALSFREPDPAVVANPNIEIVHLHPGRTWRFVLWAHYQKHFEAIFCPGIHHRADYFGLWARKATGRSIPIISTFEGLSGSISNDSREKFYSKHAGHEVYCQKLVPGHLRRLEWIYAASDHIVAISPFLARLATANFGSKVSQLPLGIDSGLYRATKRTRAGRPIVVCAGNVQPHKRPQMFLELARVFPEAQFRWYGEGEMRMPLEQDALRLGLTNISYPGPLSAAELATAFIDADIFVLPSRAEGVPKVSQEAAAAGLAQIVFGHFETPSVIDQVNGFVVWDETQFVARLGQLLASPALTARMGAASAELARAWDWNDIAPLWERRIQDCAKRARGMTGASLEARHP